MVNISRLVDIFTNWIVSLQDLWNLLNMTVRSVVEPLMISFPPFSAVGVILKIMGVYEFSILEFMLGAGLAIYVGYQLVTWLLNLVT